MAQAEKSPATNEQLINIGIIILQRAGVFTHEEQKWPTFQEHFSKYQLDLELAQPTTNSMGFHNQDANSAEKLKTNYTKKYQPSPTHLPLTTKN